MSTIQGFTRQELLELSWEKPMMAQLELTRDCNQKCVFCYKACCPEEKYSVLTVEQWKTIILKLKNLGVKRLHFSGGENFLYPGFAQLLSFGKAHGFEIWITTNGTFSCAKVAKDVDQIIFSIHGLAETHEAITQKPGSFLLARRHIVEASTMTSVSINMVLIKRNFHELNDVFGYFSQRCELSTFYSPIPIKSNSGFDYSEDSLEVTEELLEEYRAKLSMIPPQKLGLKHGYQNIYLNDPACYTSATIPLANCAAGKYKIVIDYDADVYACNFFRSPEFLCGNILSGDAKEIWHTGKGFNHFRRLSLNESFPDKCNNCIKRFKCAGGCLAWTEGYRNENYENVNDFRCEIGHAFVGG